MGESAATTFPFILRFCEMITSILAFSVVVTYEGYSKINYVMFTGITGLVLSVFFMVLYMAGNKAIRGKVSAVVDGLMWIFWLVAAAITTNMLTDSDWFTSRVRASCAFCWISWVLWTVSLFISVRETQGYEY